MTGGFRLLGLHQGGALKCALMLALVVFLAGCKTDLYSNLSEPEANEMLAALMSSGIVADKASTGATFTVQVEQADMVQAISLLDAKGLPKTSRDSIGTVFQKSGIISSPFEERVRYIYALGEEVAQTLSEIDGVVTARVHVVLPEQPQLGQPVEPSSAAVFIKHEANVDLDYMVPEIRRLVSSSIEGLKYDAVTVVLTEAAPGETSAQAPVEHVIDVWPGLGVREANLPLFWTIAYAAAGAIGVLLVVLIAGVVFLLVSRRRRRTSKEVAVTGGAALEPS